MHDKHKQIPSLCVRLCLCVRVYLSDAHPIKMHIRTIVVVSSRRSRIVDFAIAPVPVQNRLAFVSQYVLNDRASGLLQGYVRLIEDRTFVEADGFGVRLVRSADELRHARPHHPAEALATGRARGVQVILPRFSRSGVVEGKAADLLLAELDGGHLTVQRRVGTRDDPIDSDRKELGFFRFGIVFEDRRPERATGIAFAIDLRELHGDFHHLLFGFVDLFLALAIKLGRPFW
mmetsp:Transcript_15054/g.34905  ORF Transcript_15054/g.34905 Transcript_15054/m.34905 type:complete len:232 (-) Transcript_15054:313-1008(-)